MNLKQSILVTLLAILALFFMLDYWSTKQTVRSQGVQIEALKTAQYPQVVVTGDYSAVITKDGEVYIDEGK